MSHTGLLRTLLGCLSLAGCHSAAAPEVPRARVAEQRDVEQDRYRDEQAGLAISKPAAWYFISPSIERARRQSLSLSNARLDSGFRVAPEALIVIVKEPHAVGSCSPTVKVQLMSRKRGMSGHDEAHEMVEAMQKLVPSFELRSEIQDGILAGRAATHFDASLKVKVVNHDFTCDVLTHVWLIPRADDFLIIGMSAPPTGRDSSNAEFAEILASVSFNR